MACAMPVNIHCVNVTMHVLQDKNWAEALEEQRRVIAAHGPELSMEALQSMEVRNCAPASSVPLDMLCHP